MSFSSALRLFAGLGFASVTASAFAADLPSRAAPPVFTQADPGFSVTIGAGPDVVNQFPGARTITVLPSVHIGYRKFGEPDPFYTPDDSFDIALYDTPYFRIGPAANYINRRGLSNGNGNFRGLPNVDGTFQLGGFAEAFPLPGTVRLRGEILKGVNGSDALTGTVGGDLYHRFGAIEASIGPRVGFGDSNFANRYFTVTAGEAAANGLITPYQAHGGLTSVGGIGTVRYFVNRDYSLLFFGGYNRLVNSVGSSPVPVVLGSRDQFTAGVTLNYTFGFKGFGILGY